MLVEYVPLLSQERASEEVIKCEKECETRPCPAAEWLALVQYPHLCGRFYFRKR